MIRLKISFTILLLLCVFTVGSQSLAKIKKTYDKGDLKKSLTLIRKSLEKDSLAFGPHYFLSVIHLDTSSAYFDRDSSKYWIEKGLKSRSLRADVYRKDFEKAEIPLSALDSQYLRIERSFYSFALAEAAIEEYNRFLKLFPQSDFLSQITFLRDSLAYTYTEQEDTWEAYKAYMDTYSSSVFFEEARRNYEIRLFKDLTGDGSLESYISFLDKYPKTPFRKQIEESIYLRTTKWHTYDTYQDFLVRYPETHLRNKIFNILYYLSKNDSVRLSYVLKNHPERDSLTAIHALETHRLLPIINDEKYSFFDETGVDLSPSFDRIPVEYLCRELTNDWIVGKIGDSWAVANRLGEIIVSPVESIKFLNSEFVLTAITGESGKKVLHKSGFQVLPFLVGDALIVQGKWLAFKKESNWGIASFNGEVILQPLYKSIEEHGALILLESSRGFEVTNITRLLSGKNNQTTLQIDDFEPLSDTLILGFHGDKELLITSALETPIKEDMYKIYWQPEYCYVKRPNGISQLFDRTIGGLAPNAYLNIYENDNWRLLQEGTKWSITLKTDSVYTIQADSMKRLDNSHLVYYKGDTTRILFPNGRTVDPEKLSYEIARSRNERAGKTFLKLFNNKITKVYDSNGSLLFEGNYESVYTLNDSTFVVNQKGKEGVIDSKKATILRPEYDLIEGHGDLVVLLKKGMIGCLDLKHNAFIPSIYQSRILEFGRYYEVSKEGKKGLITDKNKPICPIQYDELLFWNDTSFWAKQGSRWSLLGTDGKQIMTDVSIITQWDCNPSLGIYIFLKESKYGIVSKTQGVILPPQYNDIQNLGTDLNPVYFAEQHLVTAEFFIVTYFNSSGAPFKSQAFRSDEYDSIYCDESMESGILVE